VLGELGKKKKRRDKGNQNAQERKQIEKKTGRKKKGTALVTGGLFFKRPKVASLQNR